MPTLIGRIRLFFVLICVCALPASAFDPTPLRISFKPKVISAQKTTIGLDLGILQAATHRVVGVQFAPSAIVGNLYGVQVGLLQANIEGQGYGVQIAGITTFANTAHTFYGMQLGVLANNFSFDRTTLDVAGVQTALVLNLAGSVRGIQIGAINDTYNLTGMQLGGYNKVDRMNGLQLGVSNFSEEVRGVQIGLVNRALKLRGVQLGLINILSEAEKTDYRVLPVVNISW